MNWFERGYWFADSDFILGKKEINSLFKCTSLKIAITVLLVCFVFCTNLEKS